MNCHYHCDNCLYETKYIKFFQYNNMNKNKSKKKNKLLLQTKNTFDNFQQNETKQLTINVF